MDFLRPPAGGFDLSRLAANPDGSATFAEQEELKAILLAGHAHFDIQAVGEVAARGPSFALYTASIGSRDPRAPAVGFFGGIHGLERIGTQLILAWMRALLFRLEWDELLHQQLQKVRLVFMPIVKPGGMWAHKRANPRGVDLMRGFRPGPRRRPTPRWCCRRRGRLVDPRCSHRVAGAWQAAHHSHPWAGHDLPRDDPAWVCQQLARWLAGS